MNKENIAATPTFTRKRAKSFSTPPTIRPFSKAARGILKGNAGDDAHTIAFIPIHSPSKKKTASAEKRRKSLSRRVSFASHASVRLFEKPGENSPQETPRRSGRLSPAKSPIPNAARARDSPRASGSAVEDDSEDELTMDLTSVLPQRQGLRQFNPLAASPLSDSDSESDEELNEDDTAAMDLTDIVPIQLKAATPTNTPRKSMLPIRSRQSPRPASVQAEDEDQAMDMTTVFSAAGPVLDPSSPFLDIAESGEGMDMTKIVGGILSAGETSRTSPLSVRSSPRRKRSLASAIEEDADETVNMDETRIFSLAPANAEDHTNHTSVTVATEEDSTQRLCEGSITQADGFTQNMEFTRVYLDLARPLTAISPLKPSGVGFAWGAAIPDVDRSIMDISMADVTQNDETMNMDMTQVVPREVSADLILNSENILQNFAGSTPEMNDPGTISGSAKETKSDDASISFPGVLSTRTPQPSPLNSIKRSPRKDSVSARSSARRSLPGSGPIRLPTASSTATTPTKQASTAFSTPARQSTTPSRTPISRRKSLLEAAIVPKFGTPESQAVLGPGSAQRPEFASSLINTNDVRMSALKQKIKAMTPKKGGNEHLEIQPLDARKDLLNNISPSKRARFETPQKTPQRSLLAPNASVSRTAMTPARNQSETTMDQITLDEFLKMTGVSFLTGLSTTRRRETMAIPKTDKDEPESEDSLADKLIAKAYTLPMLEMYQHSCKELNRYILEGRAMCAEIESDMNEQNPEVFEQYRRASPSEKRELEAKFKALKTVARLSAKGVWYVWRENLISGVLVPLKKNLADLEEEVAQLKEQEELAEPAFEALKKQHEELKTRVDELLKEEAAYEAFDHEEAARLTAAIEQNEAQLAIDTAEVEALAAQDAALQEQLVIAKAEHAQLLAEVKQSEEEAEKNRGYSPAEVAELKQVYQDFVDKTGLRIVHVTEQQLKLTFEQTLEITISLPDTAIELSLVPSSPDVIHRYYLQQLISSLQEFKQTHKTIKECLAFIKTQWSGVELLRRELAILETTYPVCVRVNEDDNVQITVPVLLSASRTKFIVDFVSTPSLSKDECHLDVAVAIKYGGLDCARVQQHIQSRVQSQIPALRSPGWLLESLKMPEGL